MMLGWVCGVILGLVAGWALRGMSERYITGGNIWDEFTGKER